MEFQLNREYEGFRLKDRMEIPEIYSTALIFEHEASGARLLKLVNDDDNRVFSIGFRTPPRDNTGLTHILEHSVLTGSRKYPTKEPFVDLLKGSLNTFLNAYTFPDKTVYPLASRNEQDFFNLMDVYLDAVFYPLIYEHPDRLMQEGWHYEIDAPADKLGYSGIVYNEMKGVFSSPENLLDRMLQKSLFPATSYRFESGGDPGDIPRLTQEEFIAFHKTYYHPSNSYIYLYGQGDTLRELAYLHNSWLHQFKKIKVDSALKLQAPFAARARLTAPYPVAAGEKTAGKTYLALGFVIGTALDAELELAMEILTHFLLKNPAAPLRRELLRAGLGSDVIGSWEDDLVQPYLSIVVKNSEEARASEYQSLIQQTLTELVRTGLEPALLEASINLIEFKLREAEIGSLPKGLFYNFMALTSWIYDASPVLHLHFEPGLRRIREQAGQGYFESIIKKYLIDNSHSSLIVLRPEPGLATEQERLLDAELARRKAELPQAELEKIIGAAQHLKEMQSTPDSEEALRTIPMLSRQDISPVQEIIPSEHREEQGLTIRYQPLVTNGIAYLDCYFDTSGLDAEQLPYLGLLSRLLGKIDTTKRDYIELAREVNRHTGGITYPVECFSSSNSADDFTACLTVKSRILADKFPELLSLLEEILLSSDFHNEQRLHEMVKEIKSRYEMQFSRRPDATARTRLLANFSPSERYYELSTGLSFYRFITDIDQRFSTCVGELKDKLKSLLTSLFTKNGLVIGLTGTEDIYRRFAARINHLAAALPGTPLPRGKLPLSSGCRQEGFILPGSQVQYVFSGANFLRAGYTYHGSLEVLSSIVNLDYLWNRVRIQGGAYGTGIRFKRNGDLWFYSFRDPHLRQTLDIYRQTGAYIRNFKASGREMMKYLIGTIADLDAYLTPSQKGDTALKRYFAGITSEDLQRRRDQVLSTGVADLNRYAAMLEEVLATGCLCVIGSESKLREESRLFEKIEKLIE